MKKILVIGGSGYIGSALCPHLESAGFQVDVIDPLWFPPPGGVSTFANEYHWEDERPDAVIYLAGMSSVAQCKNEPLLAFRHNVQEFVECLQATPDGVPFIYASSASVYGSVSGPASENHPLAPALNPYDMTKQMIDMYARESGKLAIGLRFGSVNGYSPNPRLDMIVPMMMHSAMTEEVVRVTNGSNFRAVLSMKDLCGGVEAILKSKKRLNTGVYNMCSFNLRIDMIGYRVAEAMGVRLEELDKQTTQYSFLVSPELFKWEFNYEFDQRVNAVIEDVKRIDWASVKDTPQMYRRDSIPSWAM